MEKIALKVGGIVFVLVAALHLGRAVMQVPVVIGQTDLPVGASIVCGGAALALGMWMLKLACGCCCKK
jgi:hypothetical protein